MAVVRQSFKPEFLNRLDEIVLFDALTQDDLAHIVDLQIAALAQRLAARRITVDVTERRARLADRAPATTRRTAPGRCGGSSRPPSATRWRGCCSPARSPTASTVGVDHVDGADGLTLTVV